MKEAEAVDSRLSGGLSEGALGEGPVTRFPWWKFVSILGLAFGWLILVRVTPLWEVIIDWQQMKAYLDRTDPFADVVFVVVTALLVGMGAPRLPFCALGGLGFGFGEGLLLSQIGTLLGACLAFAGARKLGIRWSRLRKWRVSDHPTFRLLDKWAAEPSTWSVFLLRQAPINGLLVNLFLGLSDIRTRFFVIGTALGFLPQASIATLVGSGLGKESLYSALFQLIVASLLIGGLALLAKRGWDRLVIDGWLERARVRLGWFERQGSSAMKSLRQLRDQTARSTDARCLALITLLGILLFAIRLSGPPDLEGYAQYRNVGYVIDTVTYGHWWVPLDLDGEVTSKPPFHTWVAAGISSLVGDVNRFTLTFPSFLSALATSWLLFFLGKRFWGVGAGFYAGLIFLASPLVTKHLALVRPDALFMFAVALGAWTAFQAWQRGRGWTAFWLIAAVATLTKGPLGLWLASCGLFVAVWERATGTPHPIQGRHMIGLACYLGTIGLWGILAWNTYGTAVVDKMIFDELLGHAGGMGREGLPGREFWKPTLYLLGRFAPWSLLTLWAVWRMTREPNAVPHTRRWERFLICWLAFGLLGFSLAANHRADHLLPIFPAAALLTGAQIRRISLNWRPRTIPRVMTLGVATVVLTLTVYYHHSPSRRAKVQAKTTSMKRLAATLQEEWGEDVSIVYVDTPATLQFYLKDYRHKVPIDEAARRLKADEAPLVAVRNLQELYDHYDGESEKLNALLEWPKESDEEPEVYIVGRPETVEEF